MRLTVRPITLWPGKLRTPSERVNSPFSVSWTRATHDLEREVQHLDKRGYGAVVVVEMMVTEADIRIDGWVRAGIKPSHPGVILHVETRHGPLKLWTDRFRDWEGNIRAISLYLQNQRAAERYGLGRGDEAFVGWKAIGPSAIEVGPGPQPLTYEMAINLIALHSGKEPTYVENYANACFRVAAAKHHPDVNKDPGAEAIYRELCVARDLIVKTREAK